MKAHLLWSFTVMAQLLVDQQQHVGRGGYFLDFWHWAGPSLTCYLKTPSPRPPQRWYSNFLNHHITLKFANLCGYFSPRLLTHTCLD